MQQSAHLQIAKWCSGVSESIRGSVFLWRKVQHSRFAVGTGCCALVLHSDFSVDKADVKGGVLCRFLLGCLTLHLWDHSIHALPATAIDQVLAGGSMGQGRGAPGERAAPSQPGSSCSSQGTARREPRPPMPVLWVPVAEGRSPEVLGCCCPCQAGLWSRWWSSLPRLPRGPQQVRLQPGRTDLCEVVGLPGAGPVPARRLRVLQLKGFLSLCPHTQ